MSFMGAHQSLSYGLQSVVPNPPKWVGTVVMLAAFVAAAADFAAGRAAERPLPKDDKRERLAAFYRQRIKEMEGDASHPSYRAAAVTAPGVGVTINVGPQVAAAPPSRYMMEEGNGNIDTDCFSCATGHLAATEKWLGRAHEVAQTEGGCGPKCQRLAQTAVEEPLSLLGVDWTDARVNALPPAQKAVISRYRGEVRDLVGGLVGSEQVAGIYEAKGLLDESVRFLNSGDGLDHPEVAGRLSQAEANLAGAERLDIDAFDVETANKLRTIRQAVGSKINSPEDLKAVRQDLKGLTARVNDQAFAGLDTTALAAAHAKVIDIRERFTRDRKGVA